LASLSLITLYIPANEFYKWLFIAVGISTINTILAISMWGILGVKISAFLKNRLYQKIFNFIMAILLLVSVTVALYKA